MSNKFFGFRAMSMSDDCDSHIVPCAADFTLQADLLVSEDKCNDETHLVTMLKGWTVTAKQVDYNLDQLNLMFGGLLAPAVVEYGRTLRMGGQLVLPEFNVTGQVISSDGLSTLLLKLYRVKLTSWNVTAAQDSFLTMDWTGRITELLQEGTVSLSQEVYTALVPVFPDLSCAIPWLLPEAVDKLDITACWLTPDGNFWELPDGY